MDKRSPKMIAEEEERMKEFKKDFIRQTEKMVETDDQISTLRKELEEARAEVEQLRQALEKIENHYRYGPAARIAQAALRDGGQDKNTHTY
jgi:flagellar biosynthesis chaperone FliJ